MKPATPLLPTPPFTRSYWGVPGKILAGFHPGDRDPRVAMNKLHALLECGVTDVLSLMEPAETDHAGRCFEDYRPILLELARQQGLSIGLLSAPIRDVSVPSLRQMTTTLDAIDDVLARRGMIYLHCWGGRGRTGTVLGCWLARHGEHDALGKLQQLTAHARSHFPEVPETPEQQRFVRNWRAGE